MKNFVLVCVIVVFLVNLILMKRSPVFQAGYKELPSMVISTSMIGLVLDHPEGAQRKSIYKYY